MTFHFDNYTDVPELDEDDQITLMDAYRYMEEYVINDLDNIILENYED